VLLGGVLTGLLTWHWIFLVNVPIGIAVWILVTRVVEDHRPATTGGQLDVPGASLVTVALMLAVYGVVGGNDAGWTSTKTLAILAAAVVLLAAMGDVEPHEAGLASGVVNTSFMMGGALGLAVLVALSSSRTGSLVESGSSVPEALTGGYQLAFAAGAVMAALAAVVGGVFLRPQPMGGADPHAVPAEDAETYAA
jgi:MFS family permease